MDERGIIIGLGYSAQMAILFAMTTGEVILRRASATGKSIAEPMNAVFSNAMKASDRLEKCLNRFQSIHNASVRYPSVDVISEFASLIISGYSKKYALYRLKLMIRSGYDKNFMQMRGLIKSHMLLADACGSAADAIGEFKIFLKGHNDNCHLKIPIEKPHYRDLEFGHKKKGRV